MIGLAAGAGFLAGAAFGPLLPVAVGLVLISWQIATRHSPSLTMMFVTGVAIALGTWRGEPLPEFQESRWSEEETSFIGTVVGAPGIRGDGQVFFVLIDPPQEAGSAPDDDLRLYVTAPALPEVGPGDRVWIAGTPEPIRTLPTGFGRYLRSNAAAGWIDAVAVRIEDRAVGWRHQPHQASDWLGRLLTRAVPGDRGALLAGLVSGRDDALSPARRDAFRLSGTSHLTAVSGSNLALLVTIATVSGRVSGLRRRVAWQLGVVTLLWGYALLAGFQPPVNRAALVATGVIAAELLGRRADVATLLMLGGAVMVAVDPLVLWSLSFQLSLAASLGLALALGDESPVGWKGWLRAGLVATVAAQLATLPFAVGTFGQVPLLAIPANLIVAPLAGCAFTLAAFAGLIGLAFEPVGELIAAVAAVPAGLVLSVVDLLGGRGAVVVPIRTDSVGTAAVAVFCALAVCLWSREGQAWMERTLNDARGHRRRVFAMFGTAALGLAVVLAFQGL